MAQSDAIGLIKQYQKNRELFKSNPNNMRNSTQAVTSPSRRYVTPGGMAGQGKLVDGAYSNNMAPESLTMGVAPQSLAQYGPSQTPYGYAMSQEAIDAGMNVPTTGGDSWLAANKDAIGGVAQGLQAAAGLANAYMGYKNYGLAKDMFGFEKAATNRNIANQAQLVNNEIQNAGEVGMSLAGNTMDPNARAARQAQLNTMKVSGSPVG